ncbi:hypothetical protein SL103_14135 [Streptomyces lydicus]|uniref:Uncharacterized protein n=1 Tax=Streptomyces lydicus TaxID=47763 RepID=A0A1D7VKF7_9ACTN|nr:hypothetical protein SL103_14135 [Streptomyces lydicus]
MSAWPACRAVSSIVCTSTPRIDRTASVPPAGRAHHGPRPAHRSTLSLDRGDRVTVGGEQLLRVVLVGEVRAQVGGDLRTLVGPAEPVMFRRGQVLDQAEDAGVRVRRPRVGAGSILRHRRTVARRCTPLGESSGIT